MARTIEDRTETRTVRTRGADILKTNISNIASEIARVRDQAREEVSALEKIRGMLDTGYLNDLLKSVEELEARIDELENMTLQSQTEVERYQNDLKQEQDRLAKLWDAYKIQEDELERLKRDYPLMEEKLFERDHQIQSLQKELDRMEPLAAYKDEYDALKKQYDALVREKDRLEEELRKANDALQDMEKEVLSLRELEPEKRRAEELEAQLEQERERLAKLYRVYEDLEAEKNDAVARLDAWANWFKDARAAMDSVYKVRDNAPV